MWKKIISFRYWGHVFIRVYKLLKSAQIPIGEKMLFIIPVVVYWVIPDVMPFIPVDDIVVSMFLASWFAKRMETKYNISNGKGSGMIDRKNSGIVDERKSEMIDVENLGPRKRE